MNNEDKLFKLMTEMYNEMQDIKADVNTIKLDISDLKEGQTSIKGKLDDIEINNANRHIDFTGDLRNIKNKLTKLEIVTADNWGDIARIKAVGRHKTK